MGSEGEKGVKKCLLWFWPFGQCMLSGGAHRCKPLGSNGLGSRGGGGVSDPPGAQRTRGGGGGGPGGPSAPPNPQSGHDPCRRAVAGRPQGPHHQLHQQKASPTPKNPPRHLRHRQKKILFGQIPVDVFFKKKHKKKHIFFVFFLNCQH